MNELTKIIVLAGIAEAIWETIKMTYDHGKIEFSRLGAIFIGVLLCMITGADLLKAIGFNVNIPYVGQVLTGLLISRGANFAHDIFTSINNLQQNTKNQK